MNPFTHIPNMLGSIALVGKQSKKGKLRIQNQEREYLQQVIIEWGKNGKHLFEGDIVSNHITTLLRF